MPPRVKERTPERHKNGGKQKYFACFLMVFPVGNITIKTREAKQQQLLVGIPLPLRIENNGGNALESTQCHFFWFHVLRMLLRFFSKNKEQ